jgi:uncharacterized SAM-binding protein YcdF (DUF218 family)
LKLASPIFRRWQGWAGLSILFALFLWLFWLLVLPRLGGSIIASEPPQAADLILVLGGDFLGPRVLKAAELCALGYAPLVLISSPPYQGRPEGEFAIRLLESKGYPKEMFAIAAHYARSTRAEAIALRREFQRRKCKRVILVTSAYHSRRTSVVFKLVFPGVRFISVPAADFHYDPDRWLNDKVSRTLFFSEWSKIVGTLLLAPALAIERIFWS